jgi:hypothetical protein
MLDVNKIPIGSLVKEFNGDKQKIEMVCVQTLVKIQTNPQNYVPCEITPKILKIGLWNHEPLQGRDRFTKNDYKLMKKWGDDDYLFYYKDYLLTAIKHHHQLQSLLIALP